MVAKPPPNWPSGGGEMALLIRSHDWNKTPLGGIEDWTDRFRAAVDLVLDSPLVASLVCGKDYLFLYNDAAAALYGENHPAALGRPLPETYPDGWAAVAPHYEKAFAGEPVSVRSQALDLRGENGSPPDIFDAYLTPIRDSGGRVVAVMMVGVETGAQRRAEVRLRESEERQAFLLRFADSLRPLGDSSAIQAAATGLLRMQLGAERARYIEIDETACVARAGRDQQRAGASSVASEHPLARFAWSLELLRRNGLVISDTRVSPLVPEADRGASAALGIISCMGAPLVKDGRLVGALCVTDTKPRDWTAQEIAIVQDAAERTWAAVERARAEADLKASEERYRSLFNAMDEGVMVLERLGRRADGLRDYRYAAMNAKSQEMFATGDLTGHSVRDHFPGEDEEWYDLFDDALDTGEVPRFEREARSRGLVLQAYLARMGESGSKRVMVVMRDVTAQRRAAEALGASEERYRELADALPIIVWELDASGLVRYVNDRWSEQTGRPASEAAGLPWLFTTLPDDQRRMEAAWDAAVRGGSVYEAEFRVVQPSGEVRWFFSRGIPVKSADGTILRWVGSDADVTAFKRAEERTRFLMREVNHRSKNLLAVVQAIAKQTAAEVDPRLFSARFGERLQGLAATQDLLIRNDWKGADLGQLIRSQLAHFGDLLDRRIRLEGPAINVTAAAAQNLGLALHELATNAGKYGALSNSTGELDIRWSVTWEAGAADFLLEWKEINGPAVVAPTRRGLGTLLVTRITEGAVSGTVDLLYDPAGLIWRLRAPLQNLVVQFDPAG